MVKVHYSSLRPFTYINVSGTYAYITSDKLICEYMSVWGYNIERKMSLKNVNQIYTGVSGKMSDH